jgi:serine/threonine protein kinase
MDEESDIGPYRIVRRIALRERSEVLLARVDGPHGFQRTVILKRLVDRHAHDGLWLRRLAAEAIAYARLSHSSIVRLYDFVLLDHAPTLVLEYVPGASLETLVRAKRDRRERFADADALYIGSRVFAALAAAHGARHPETGEFSPVIHRDVSPGNVLVSRHGEVKLGDFGVARVSGVTEATPSGTLLGTYGYMAPEQILGDAVTVRADVYGAALLMWELLAGRHAFDRESLPELEILQAMAEPRIPPIERLRPDLPPDVCEALGRALRADADERIGARDMLETLRAHVNGAEARASLADDVGRTRRALTDAAPASPAPGAWIDSPHPSEPDATTDHGMPSYDDAPEPTLTPQPRSRLALETPTALVITPPSPMATTLRMHGATNPLHPRRARREGAFGSVVVVAMGLLTVLAASRVLVRPAAIAPRTARAAVTTSPTGPRGTDEPFERAPTDPASLPATAATAATAPAVDPGVAAAVGTLETPASMAEHRVFVDGLARGSGGVALRLSCGRHLVRLGSQGRLQWIDVPCGGTVRVDR